MTTATNDCVERYEISGVGPYAFSFRIFADTDLTVVALSTATPPAVVPLTLNTHYTVQGENVLTGGTVTLDTDAATDYDGYTVDIRSNTPQEQPTSIRNQGNFLPSVHEEAFDRLSRQVQDQQRRVNACLRTPDNMTLSGEMTPISAWLSKYVAVSAAGQLEPADSVGDTILSQSVIGALLYPQTQAESDAGVVPTDLAIPSHEACGKLNILRYGGAGGDDNDNTDAMNDAALVARQINGGGVIILPYMAEWPMNFVFAQDNLKIEMVGGRAEFDQYCIRPFGIGSAALAVGDEVSDIYYCGLINCHVSGTVAGSQVTGGSPAVGVSAPQALLIRGGTQFFTTDQNCRFYSGIQTVALVPRSGGLFPGAPVSGCRINGCVRNDTTGTANARALYLKRNADPGYNTANTIDIKLNSTGSGYACEIDGTGNPLVGILGGYWDIKPGLGVLLKGSSVILPVGYLHLDPGTTGVVVVETTDSVTDIADYIQAGGALIADGQLFRTAAGGGTNYTIGGVTIPTRTTSGSVGQIIKRAFLTLPFWLSKSTNSFDQTASLDTDSDTGPLTLNQMDFSVKTAGKGLRVAEGSNAKQGLSVLVGGTVTVSNTSVTANSRILLTSNVDGGTPGWLRVSAITAATSFVITSSNGADTSSVAWQIFEPA